MHKTVFFSVLLSGFCLSNCFCPKFISCETSETSCPQGLFYRENVKVHGCCPGCVTLKGENGTCELAAECEPGLTCRNEKCTRDPSQVCEFYKRFDNIFAKTKYWKPVCLQDGNYGPKQCKGEKLAGKCFCVNKTGKRIFGEEDWDKAENMTCACSRLAEEAREKGRESSLHCDRVGNFEPLQCEGGVCWCANPSTGAPYTTVVPPQMIISLPCYDRDAVGAQYHRQCDSMSHVQEMTKSLLENHGTTGIIFTYQKCNFDGSYHRVQTVREKIKCVYVNNSPLTEAVELRGADCNCAFDRHVALTTQTEFLSECLPNGNYRNRQNWNGHVYCVDRDGFHYSNDPGDCPLAQR